MAGASKEYIRSLIPDNLPDGRKLLQEGRAMGKSITAGRSRFIRDSPFDNYVDFWIDYIKKGDLYWATDIGLATVEEEAEGIAELYQWCQTNRIKYHTTLGIPSTLTAVPKELRRYDSKNTSYVLETLEDYMALENIKGMEVMQCDHVLGVPNSIETGINALKSGSFQVGGFSQLLWNHAGCDDHVKYVTDMVKMMGILSSKWEEGFGTSGYSDDAYPSYCTDVIAYVGYALFEHYIATKLCGVRYTIAYGGLVSDIRIRAALLKAFHDLFYTEEQPPILFMFASTTRFWDHDLEANYGMAIQEALMGVLAERRFKTGAMIMPVPITEKVHVPTIEAIKGIIGACSRLEENIEQWEDLIDFTKIEEMAEVLKSEGTKFFNNMLSILSESGVDIEDPLQLLMFVKNFNPGLFEETFHPSTQNGGDLKTFYPTDMALLTRRMLDEEYEKVCQAGFSGALDREKILLASTDAHAYGLRCAKDILKRLGAEIVDAGVDASVPYMLDLADEEGIRCVGVSTHNGQALGVAEELLAEAEKRNMEYVFFIGGMLNTILPGHSEPSDVTGIINEKGVYAENDFVKLMEILTHKNSRLM